MAEPETAPVKVAKQPVAKQFPEGGARTTNTFTPTKPLEGFREAADALFPGFDQGLKNVGNELTPGYTGGEAPPPTPDSPQTQTTDQGTSGNSITQLRGLFKGLGTKGGAKANAFLVGQSSPQLPDAMQAQKEKHEAAIHAGNVSIGYSALQAGYVQEEVIGQFADIAVADHAAIRDLVQNEFPKFRQKQQQLQDDLDDVRSRKINPYSYLQQAGTGGRAALSLATAVGQLAAGAGNISSAQATVTAAIERDISSQMTNITNAYKGIAAASSNIAEQIALIETEISFRERARAVAYEAAKAVIDEAMQKANNEAAYINLKLYGDYLGLQGIQAYSDYLAKTATIHYKMPVSNYHTALKRAGQVGEFQQALEKAFNSGQQVAGQQQAADAVTAAQGTGQARTPGTPSGSAKTARPAVAANRPTIGPGTPEQQVPDSLAADTRSPDQVDQDYNDRAITNIKGTLGEVGTAIDRIADEGMRSVVKKEGGWAAAIQAAHGDTFPPAPRIKDSLLSLEDDPSGFFAQNNENKPWMKQDADAVASHWKKTRDMSDERNRYIGSHPELFEGDTFIDMNNNRDIRTTINSSVWGQLHIKRGASARTNEAQYNEMVTELAAADKTMNKYKEAYKALERTAMGNIWGLSVLDGGIKWTPTSAGASQGLQMAQRLMTEVGIELIKTLDPAGRLSDQDVKLAKGMISWAEDNNWAKFANAIDTITNEGGTPGDIQQGIMNTLRYFANARFEGVINKYSNSLVLPPDLHFMMHGRDNELKIWMNEGDQ